MLVSDGWVPIIKKGNSGMLGHPKVLDNFGHRGLRLISRVFWPKNRVTLHLIQSGKILTVETIRVRHALQHSAPRVRIISVLNLRHFAQSWFHKVFRWILCYLARPEDEQRGRDGQVSKVQGGPKNLKTTRGRFFSLRPLLPPPPSCLPNKVCFRPKMVCFSHLSFEEISGCTPGGP